MTSTTVLSPEGEISKDRAVSTDSDVGMNDVVIVSLHDNCHLRVCVKQGVYDEYILAAANEPGWEGGGWQRVIGRGAPLACDQYESRIHLTLVR